MTDDVNTDGNLLVGPVRQAQNRSDISIHNEATAVRLGFRGSAVAMSVHLDLFPRVLVAAYGDEWFERGAVSLYGENVVVHGETVQAVAELPIGNAPIRTWARFAETPDQIAVAGTAAIGDSSSGELQTRNLRLCPSSDLRILRGLDPGVVLQDTLRRADSDNQIVRVNSGQLSDTLPWYSGQTPWGGPIACLSTIAGYFHDTGQQNVFEPWVGDTPGMYGAFEIVHVAGPLMLDTEYRVLSTVVGVGQSPKTEYCWWDSAAIDDGGTVVATMRHLQRYLKAGSSLYPELAD
jgi:hypothetical protein